MGAPQRTAASAEKVLLMIDATVGAAALVVAARTTVLLLRVERRFAVVAAAVGVWKHSRRCRANACGLPPVVRILLQRREKLLLLRLDLLALVRPLARLKGVRRSLLPGAAQR